MWQQLLQFSSVDVPSEPIAVNPACVAWLTQHRGFDGKPEGTLVCLTSGSSVLVAESYEAVLDALQSVEVGS